MRTDTMFMIGGCAGSGAAPSENRPIYDPTAPWKIRRRPFRRDQYGSRTTCFLLRYHNTIVVVDHGLGVNPVSEFVLDMLEAEGASDAVVHCVQTHYHEDHLEGLRSNLLLFQKGIVLKFYSPNLAGFRKNVSRCATNMLEVLSAQFCESYWPVTLETLDKIGAQREHVSFELGDTLQVGEISMRTIPLSHPGGCAGLRFETPGHKSIVVATDFESAPAPDPNIVDFFNGADLLLADMQYTDEEYEGNHPVGRVTMSREGWGHGTPNRLLPTILACSDVPKSVRITHHEPGRSDMNLRMFYEHSVNLLESWKTTALFDYQFAQDGDIFWL